jgi:hypothetical protein
MTKEEIKTALHWAKEHEKCDQHCKVNGTFQRLQCFAYQALLFVHKTSAEALVEAAKEHHCDLGDGDVCDICDALEASE